jgi:hypothetical protein
MGKQIQSRLIIRDPVNNSIIVDKIYKSKKKAIDNGYTEEVIKLKEIDRPSKHWLKRNFEKTFKHDKFNEYVHVGYTDIIPLWERPTHTPVAYIPNINIQKEKSIEMFVKYYTTHFSDKEVSDFLPQFYTENRVKCCLTQLPVNEYLLPLRGEFAGERLLRCNLESIDILQNISWGISRDNTDNYERIDGCVDNTKIRPHRLVMKCTHGDNKLIDHINGITTDVRLKNLRESNDVQNAQNRRSNKGFFGVTKSGKKWTANITNNDGEQVYLGIYTKPEEAAMAFDKASIELRGENGTGLNFPIHEKYIARGIDDELFEFFKSTFRDHDEVKLKEFAEDVCKFAWERAQIVPQFIIRPKVETVKFTPHKGQSEPLKNGQKFIELHGKYGVNRFLRCSEEDFEMLNAYKWNVNRQRSGYESVRASIGKGKTVYAHRLVSNSIRGDGTLIDHKNGDTLNVTRENLEQSDRVKNSQNQGSRINTSSKSVGVSYNNRDKRWKAQVTVDGKKIYIGCFEEEKDAVKARDDAVIKYGLNSRLNNTENVKSTDK